ncbi:hypothetical protein Tco_1348846, partial [Tanacetum coccineum]
LWLHPLFLSLLRRILGTRSISGWISFTQSLSLLGVPIQEERAALRFRVDITEADKALLRDRIKTTEAIEKITRNRKRQACIKIEQQLAAFQESLR